jgi:hypothetical protein
LTDINELSFCRQTGVGADIAIEAGSTEVVIITFFLASLSVNFKTTIFKILV